MMFALIASTALAGGGSEAAYVEKQLVREIHDSRHYETSYVSTVVGDQVVTTPQQNVVGTMTFEVMQNKTALTGWDFATAIGDDALVAEKRANQKRKHRVFRIALGVGGAGLVSGVVLAASEDDTIPASPFMTVGWIGLIGGGIGSFYFRDYGEEVTSFYTIEEIDAMIHVYNTELATSLGLNPDTMAKKHPDVVTFDH